MIPPLRGRVGMQTSRTLGVGLLLVMTSAVSCSSPEVRKQRHFENAEAHAAQKNDELAILEYRNAIKADRRFGQARLRLAEAYAREAKPLEASKEFLVAAELLPESSQAQTRAAAVLLVSREFDRARQFASAALAIDPANLDAQIILAHALAELKDPEAAMQEIQHAIELDPGDPRAFTSLGMIRAREGNRAEAEAAFKRALELAPRSVQAHHALALFYWAIQRPLETEATLLGAADIEPDNALTNRMLAMLYLTQGRMSVAERPLRKLADAEDPSAVLTLGDIYLASDRIDKARALYETLKGNKQRRTTAIARLAMLDYSDGKTDHAHRLVDEELAAAPSDTQLLGVKTGWYVAEHRLDDALRTAQAAVAGAPSFAAAHYRLALVYLARREPENATKALSETLRLNPRIAAAQLHLSTLLLARGEAAKAVTHAEAALELDPRNSLARLGVATALLRQGDLVRAHSEVQKLLSEYPDFSAAHALKGDVLRARADHAAATRAFDRALELNPSNLRALSGRIAADFRANRPQNARARVERALARAPDWSELLVLAARFERSAGDRSAAAAHLARSIEVAPENLEAYVLLGRGYMEDRKLDEARAEYERLAARRPDLVGYKTMVGMILEMQQRTDEAIQVYEDAVRADAGAPVAANNLAYQYAERGQKLVEALNLAQLAKRHLPDRPEVDDTLGWVFFKNDMPSQAIPPLESSVAKNPRNAIYRYHLGLAYAKVGRSDDARRSLEEALAMRPDLPGASKARAVLASLPK